MSIKIKTISTVQLPPPKCRKNLFHVVLTVESLDAQVACGAQFFILSLYYVEDLF